MTYPSSISKAVENEGENEMRLIDADAFKKYIRDACNKMSHVYKDGGKWAKQITEDFCMDIDEQPTIEERKTGKWIGYNTEQDGWKRTDGSPVFMSCSECNGLVFNNGSAHWNFCPNCGAKMEVEE